MFVRTCARKSLTMLASAVLVVYGETAASQVTNTSLGEHSPTFVGPAARGCNDAGCSLLSGPFLTPSTASLSTAAAVARPLTAVAVAAPSADPQAMPLATRPRLPRTALAAVAGAAAVDPPPPSVSCRPLGAGCDTISSSASGAVGVKGINAVDSGTLSTNLVGDIEPSDQGLCAGNGYVVETNNIGEILIFDTALQRQSAVIPLDTLMGLTARGWSSGGDPSCLYDYDNGGHWIFTQFVSASPESAGGPFAGCFAGVANTCYEGIAVTVGSNPFGPYNVYFHNSDYNPSEPGYPYLLNDFAKIATTRDALLLFYDEFPLVVPGLGGGFFNGAQQFAYNKKALELGLPVIGEDGRPNRDFTVAIENMGLLLTPDGSCLSDNTFHRPGFTCWYAAIPAVPPDPTQYDNSHGGSGFMVDTLDFYGNGDTRIAVFYWKGLGNLNRTEDEEGSGIRFGGQLFSGVSSYYGEGFLAAQKSGRIPLGDECGAAGLSASVNGAPAPATCPEGGIATNGDSMTQASQAQHQIWAATTTEISQSFASEESGATQELHQGAVYWVIGTDTFDSSGVLSLTSQGYVSPAHQDLEFPTMAAEGFSEDGGNGGAIMSFTLSGDGGPRQAHDGGYYPSSAYGRLNSTSNGLLQSEINIADPGQAPQDGFSEYAGYPGPTRPRWGDYGNAIFLPFSGSKIYFASGYIQYPNCEGSEFTFTSVTCGGTRDFYANWGTSVNYVVP